MLPVNLSFHHADGLNSDTSAANDFDVLEFFFDQFDNGIVFGCSLDKLKKKAVFAIIDDSCLEGLCNLEKLHLVCCGAFLDFDVKNLFHADKDICKVNDFDDFDHAV